MVEDGRRCHDRVCPLPLIVLRKRLEKVERKLLAEQTLEEDSRREDFGILTRTALQKRSDGFKAYLAEVRAKVGGVLEVEGTALITVECKRFDTVLQEGEVNVFETKKVLKEFEKEEVLDAFETAEVLQEVLHVQQKSVHEKISARELAEQYCFQWRFVKNSGTLRSDKDRRRKSNMQKMKREEDVFAIFHPGKSRRVKGFQVFSSTLHKTIARQRRQLFEEDKIRSNTIKTSVYTHKMLEKHKDSFRRSMPRCRSRKKVKPFMTD